MRKFKISVLLKLGFYCLFLSIGLEMQARNLCIREYYIQQKVLSGCVLKSLIRNILPMVLLNY